MAFDKFREECGLMGVWNNKEAANITYLGLYSQQHRGQEGAGVVSLDYPASKKFNSHKGLGVIADIFQGYDFDKLPGRCAIGHLRYTTAGGNELRNVQPFIAELAGGFVAVAHNGNLINIDQVRKKLVTKGAIFSTSSDTEVFLHLIARAKKTNPPVEMIIEALQEVRGAYSLLFLLHDRIFAVRDPAGVRPLALARLNGGIVVASETCAFDLVGAEYIRDVEPGEIVEISGENEIKSYKPFTYSREAPCIFEYVYFSRPDSNVFGRNVYAVRKKMGEELARESPADVDVVVPVPDSGMTAALGFAQVSKLPMELGLIRNHYVGRTFIEPKQSIRDFGVKVKLNANAGAFAGKRIVIVDDSLVRGTTSKKLVTMLRKAGATEVHMRVSSPPTISPCHYGIDTPNKAELIASHKSVDEIAVYIGVDSLRYLSLEGMYRAVNSSQSKMCDACFTGKYPLGEPKDCEERQAGLV
jgi:amidophosphoribosyltransferase